MTQKNVIVKQFNWTQMADGTSSIITLFSWKKTKNVQSFCRISTTMEDKMNLQQWTSVVVLLQTLFHDDSFMMRDNHFTTRTTI